MTRRRVAVAPACPDLVKDEAIVVPRGETTYTLDFDDATIELLAAGICPADVARRAWECLGWKREHYRNQARAYADDERLALGIEPVVSQFQQRRGPHDESHD
jgi:hypothetical protein